LILSAAFAAVAVAAIAVFALPKLAGPARKASPELVGALMEVELAGDRLITAARSEVSQRPSGGRLTSRTANSMVHSVAQSSALAEALRESMGSLRRALRAASDAAGSEGQGRATEALADIERLLPQDAELIRSETALADLSSSLKDLAIVRAKMQGR